MCFFTRAPRASRLDRRVNSAVPDDITGNQEDYPIPHTWKDTAHSRTKTPSTDQLGISESKLRRGSVKFHRRPAMMKNMIGKFLTQTSEIPDTQFVNWVCGSTPKEYEEGGSFRVGTFRHAVAAGQSQPACKPASQPGSHAAWQPGSQVHSSLLQLKAVCCSREK